MTGKTQTKLMLHKMLIVLPRLEPHKRDVHTRDSYLALYTTSPL